MKWIGVYAAFIAIALIAAIVAGLANNPNAYSAFVRLDVIDILLLPFALVFVIASGLTKRFVLKRQKLIDAKSTVFRDRIVIGYLKASGALKAKKINATFSIVAVVLLIQSLIFSCLLAFPSYLCPHDWEDATCTQPSTCRYCSETNGGALGHIFSQWSTVKEPTCSEEGQKIATCSRCGEHFTQSISKTAHTAGEWAVTKEATESQSGTKTLYCSVCGAAMKTETFTLSAEEIRANFISGCESYSYEDLMRDPTAIKGSKVSLRGKVIQVQTGTSGYTLRVDITQGSYGIWDDDIMVSYSKPSGSPNIMEKDIVDIYGTASGTVEYTTVFGTKRTVPLVNAKYVDIE